MGFEKEIHSLWKNLEAKKGREVKMTTGKKKHLSASRFEREL